MTNSYQSPKQKSRELSQYEQFRLGRLHSKNDDDNHSAHFHSNHTDREQDLNPVTKIFVRNGTNVSGFRQGDREQELMGKLQEKQKECNEIYAKYGELMAKYEEIQKEKQYYRMKYEERVARDKETKKKLEGWIKQAKTDLITPLQKH